MSVLCCMLKYKFLKIKSKYCFSCFKWKKENANSSCVSKQNVPYLTRDEALTSYFAVFFPDISNTINSCSCLPCTAQGRLACWPLVGIKTESGNTEDNHHTTSILHPCTDCKSMLSRNNKPLLRTPRLESPNHDTKYTAFSKEMGLRLVSNLRTWILFTSYKQELLVLIFDLRS